MALETFDFSSFCLVCVRFFFKDLHHWVFLWTSRLQAWHLLGRKECEESLIPAMSGGARNSGEEWKSRLVTFWRKVEHPGYVHFQKEMHPEN